MKDLPMETICSRTACKTAFLCTVLLCTRMRSSLCGMSILVAMTGAAFVAPTARADLFVTQHAHLNGYIGQYTDSGTAVNDQLITGLDSPVGIASYGSYLYVGDLGAGLVSKYTTSGGVVTPGLVNHLTDPRGIAVDSTGQNLFVAYSGSVIGKFDTVTGTGNADLIHADDVVFTIASSGTNIYFTSTNGTHGFVEKYTSDGVHVAKLVTMSEQLYGIAVDSSGQYFYTNATSGTVSQYDTTTGAFIKNLANPGQFGAQTPYGMTLEGSNLYVVSGALGESSHVHKYDFLTKTWQNQLITTSGGIGITYGIPEPTTWAMLTAGLGSLIAFRRRR